jgi:hypothetical protein
MNAPWRKDSQANGRTWYNQLMGNHENISFHPFSAQAVAQGSAASFNALNDCLVRNGLIAR